MSELPTCEIISIGNELLTGRVVNTNSSWLASQLTSIGWHVKRIIVIGDDLGEISKSIRDSLSRDVDCIITTGGLGPTYDDMTLRGVAKALRRPIQLNRSALEMVMKKYRAMGEPITPARRKMAELPEDSLPLPNPVGTAPGVKLSVGKTTIYSLPGVPKEMEAIFLNYIKPELAELSGRKFFECDLPLEGIKESSLAPILDEVRLKFPQIYFKSHPKCREEEPRIVVNMSTYAEDEEYAKTLLETAKKFLLERLSICLTD